MVAVEEEGEEKEEADGHQASTQIITSRLSTPSCFQGMGLTFTSRGRTLGCRELFLRSIK
jgi:hypothetical protein